MNVNICSSTLEDITLVISGSSLPFSFVLHNVPDRVEAVVGNTET